MTVTNGYMKLP